MIKNQKQPKTTKMNRKEKNPVYIPHEIVLLQQNLCHNLCTFGEIANSVVWKWNNKDHLSLQNHHPHDPDPEKKITWWRAFNLLLTESRPQSSSRMNLHHNRQTWSQSRWNMITMLWKEYDDYDFLDQPVLQSEGLPGQGRARLRWTRGPGCAGADPQLAILWITKLLALDNRTKRFKE